jgi:hypothetical protein
MGQALDRFDIFMTAKSSGLVTSCSAGDVLFSCRVPPRRASSGGGRCNASPHPKARIQTSPASSVVRITGITS